MFNRDVCAAEAVAEILRRFKVRTIIETGTARGDTTAWFASVFFGPIYSIDLNRECVKRAKKRLSGCANVVVLEGSSPAVLDTILPHAALPVLAFLDAHDHKRSPLLDELATFAKHGVEPVLMIHDFYVPGRDFGSDVYGGQRLDWGYVEDAIGRVYPNGFTRAYNDKAAGAKRGILFVYPPQKRPSRKKSPRRRSLGESRIQLRRRSTVKR